MEILAFVLRCFLFQSVFVSVCFVFVMFVCLFGLFCVCVCVLGGFS